MEYNETNTQLLVFHNRTRYQSKALHFDCNVDDGRWKRMLSEKFDELKISQYEILSSINFTKLIFLFEINFVAQISVNIKRTQNTSECMILFTDEFIHVCFTRFKMCLPTNH